MCGIYAAIAFSKYGYKHIQIMKNQLIGGAKKRGRDGDGIFEFDNGYIGASRAKPLPEGGIIEIPLQDNGLHLVFNGTLSNDVELTTEYKLIPGDVDTSVAIQLWNKIGGLETCNKLIGGFAFSVFNENDLSLTVAKNFKTLWYSHDPKHFFILSSEKEPLLTDNNIFSTFYPKRFPTNTLLNISHTGFMQYEKISRKYWSYTPDLDSNKAVVITSGGIDSITSAYIAAKHWKYNTTLINFDYKQMASIKEKEAVEYVSKQLNVNVEFINLKKLGEWGHSPLTDCNIPLPLGKQSAESTLCWTPGRNMLMLAYAAAYAEAHGAKWLVFGNNLEEEASGYSDNDLDFVYLYNLLLEYGTLKGVQIKRALARLMKPEILQVGNYLGVDYSKTWSCDLGGKSPCGSCGCCTTRRHAFMVAGLLDEQTYQNDLNDHYTSVEPKQFDIQKLLSLVE
jgi:7-cyano-7-deazaguanine synthase